VGLGLRTVVRLRKQEGLGDWMTQGHKSGHSEPIVPDITGTYVPEKTRKIGAAKRIRTPDPRIRIRRSVARALSINILRASNAVYVLEKMRKAVCAGTKVATVDHERTRPLGAT
jgi:hypothetical protein